MACLCINAIITSCAVPSFIYAFDHDDDENGQRCGAMCNTTKTFFMVVHSDHTL